MDASTNEQDVAIEKAMEWLLRLEMSPSDVGLKRDFEHWLAQAEAHRKAYASVKLTWSALGNLPTKCRSDDEVASGNVMRFSARKRGRTRSRWIAASAALAAVYIVFVASPIIQKHMLADYVSGVAELREIPLPDGSVAFLDAGSAIAVNYGEHRREVSLLAGQAFFEVVTDPNKSFKVTVDEVAVVVKGTSFGVRNLPQTVNVEVQSGIVDVFISGVDAFNRLTVGDTLAVDRQTRTPRLGQLPPSEVASWRKRQLVVYDALFADLIEELGRHLPGVVVVRDSSLNHQRITGVFDLSRPEDALLTLADSQRATVTQITPYLVVISAR